MHFDKSHYLTLTHSMKNRFFGTAFGRLAIFLAIIVAFSSCKSNLTYFQDVKTSKTVSGSPATVAPYKIQINDNLYISVISANSDMNELYNPATVGSTRSINNIWQNLQGQYVQGYLVEPDGTVNLPSIGRVNVLGLNFQEAEARIKAKAQEYLKDVTAKVRLLNYKVTVTGEVNSPGVYFNYNPEFTVFDAISSAGGLKNSATLQRVLVIRRTKSGSQEFIMNLRKSDALKSPGYLLEPNDVVIIQPSRYKNAELRLPIYTVALSTITTFLLVLNYIDNNNN
jgi:polysaccharide biosynthesis/export protein